MLEDLKLKVMNIAKQAQREGMCKHKSGNFSARDEETGYVVIPPTSVDREDLVVPDMIVMDLDANVIENQTGLRPTSESLMHLKIYQTRPDVKAVAHTHSMYATVFAVLNKPIPAVVYEVANLNCSKARIPVAPSRNARPRRVRRRAGPGGRRPAAAGPRRRCRRRDQHRGGLPQGLLHRGACRAVPPRPDGCRRRGALLLPARGAPEVGVPQGDQVPRQVVAVVTDGSYGGGHAARPL